MTKYIGVILILLINYIYDHNASAESTGWCVFYFSSFYICIGIICLDDLFSGGTITRKIYSVISILFFIRATYEISLVNLPFDEYMLAANSKLSSALFLITAIVFFALLIITNWKSWVRNLKSIGK